MPSRFQDKLKEIRDASTQKSAQELKQRSEADDQRSQRTVAGFEFRERVEAVIEEFVKNFQEEAAGFVLNRGFFEGKYMLALRVTEERTDDDGRPRREFSRVMFLLNPRPEAGSFGLQCRKTIRNRDLESTAAEAPMDDDGLARIGEFIEAQFVQFAETYFGESSRNHTTPVTS